MGLFDFIKNQFIEVIEWTDNGMTTMVYRFPVEGKEIKMGAQLTVRESQVAIFVNEGQIADVFNAGRYTLSTQNMPVLTKLKSWQYGFNSPFKAEVYFINTKQFTDQKWGTTNPIMMRDRDFGMLRLRGFGIFSFKVEDPIVFLKEVFGTNAKYDVSSISGQLKRVIISVLSDILAESQIPAIDLAMYYNELSEKAKEDLQKHFIKLGFKVEAFYIENISLPKEVEQVLDKKTSMGVLGDMQQYTQYQAAEAIRDAAKNEGGGFAAAGVGIGAGAGIGQMMAGALNNQQSVKQQPINQQTSEKKACPNCKSQNPVENKFCFSCGTKIEEEKYNCIACKVEINKDTKFCPECGTKQIKEIICPKCNAKLKPDTKFCPECGNKL